MKRVHNIRVSAICRSREERDHVRGALDTFLDMPCAPFITEETLSHPGLDDLYTLELRLDTQPGVRAALRALAGLSAADRKALVDTAEDRFDMHGRFSVRLDRDALPVPVLVSQGNVLQLRLTVAAYPNTRENALRIVHELFDNGANL